MILSTTLHELDKINFQLDEFKQRHRYLHRPERYLGSVEIIEWRLRNNRILRCLNCGSLAVTIIRNSSVCCIRCFYDKYSVIDHTSPYFQYCDSLIDGFEIANESFTPAQRCLYWFARDMQIKMSRIGIVDEMLKKHIMSF